MASDPSQGVLRLSRASRRCSSLLKRSNQMDGDKKSCGVADRRSTNKERVGRQSGTSHTPMGHITK